MKIPTRMPSGGRILGICIWGLRFVKIPTRMPSGGCILGICILGVAIRENPDTYVLGICILGVAIRENPDTYAFWGLRFGYLHSGGCDS